MPARDWLGSRIRIRRPTWCDRRDNYGQRSKHLIDPGDYKVVAVDGTDVVCSARGIASFLIPEEWFDEMDPGFADRTGD